MGANNEVVVMEKKDGFYVYHNPCADNLFRPEKNDLIKKVKSCEDALKIASNYVRENMVEYGINYIPLREKSKKK